MDTIDLQRYAGDSLDGLTVDADAMLAGALRRHRRHQWRRRAAATGASLAVAGLVAAAVVASQGTGTEQTETAGTTAVLGSQGTGADTTESAGTTVTPGSQDAPVLATVDGLELTYLPPGIPPTPVVETEPYVDNFGQTIPGGTDVSACFGNDDCVADGLNVSVKRAPGLDLDGFLEGGWLGETTETTVGGRPALTSSIPDDGFAGLIWSPRDGVVVWLGTDPSRVAELRRVADGARLP